MVQARTRQFWISLPVWIGLIVVIMLNLFYSYILIPYLTPNLTLIEGTMVLLFAVIVIDQYRIATLTNRLKSLERGGVSHA
jgi:uncharacterized membrane protein YqhA